jgi:hypothetical protein
MKPAAVRPAPDAGDPARSKSERLSLLENVALYSQYILIALLILCATVLRLVYGAP